MNSEINEVTLTETFVDTARHNNKHTNVYCCGKHCLQNISDTYYLDRCSVQTSKKLVSFNFTWLELIVNVFTNKNNVGRFLITFYEKQKRRICAADKEHNKPVGDWFAR